MRPSLRFHPGEFVLFAVTLVVVLASMPSEVKLDDAYITLRYARNFAAGDGLVYNHGEAFLGTTTPAFALLIGGLHWLTGVDLITLAAGVYWLSLLAIGGIAATLVPRECRPWMLILPGVLARLALVQNCSGMEATLFVAAGLVLVRLACNPAGFGFAVLAPVSCLIRPDAVVLVALLYVFRWHRAGRWPVRDFAVSAAAAAPWLWYALSRFGSPVPATAKAKLVQGQSDLWSSTFASQLVPTAGWVLAALLPLALVGAIVAMRRRNQAMQLLFTWTVLHNGAYALSGVPAYPWYYVPMLAQLGVLAAYGIGSGKNRWARGVLVGAVAATLLAWSLATSQRETMAPGRLEPTGNRYYELGCWLDQHVPPAASVAAVEVGIIGYFSRRRVVDLLGLVTPGIAELVLTRGHIAHVFASGGADYVISHLPEWQHERGLESILTEHYTVVRSRQDCRIYRRLRRDDEQLAAALVDGLAGEERVVLFADFPAARDFERVRAAVARRDPRLRLLNHWEPAVDHVVTLGTAGELRVDRAAGGPSVLLDGSALAMWTVAGGRRIDGPGLHVAILGPGAVARGVLDQRGPFRRIVLRLRIEALVGVDSSFGELRWNPEQVAGPRVECVRFPVFPTDTAVEVRCDLPPGRFGAADELRELWLMPMECLGVCTIESVRLDRYL